MLQIFFVFLTFFHVYKLSFQYIISSIPEGDSGYHLCDATTPRWRSAALRAAVRRRTLAPEAGKKLEETDKKAILCNEPDKRDG